MAHHRVKRFNPTLKNLRMHVETKKLKALFKKHHRPRWYSAIDQGCLMCYIYMW